ncbi:MAG: MmgE/PrpD family protein [Alphaproteobacteria bacterium]|nr:MmgE/PrpD family protein [Alphaproteobacteria bacterium]
MENATQKLCEKIVGITDGDMTEDALVRARQLFLDGLAVAVAGTIQEEPPSILAAHAKEMGGNEVSTVIGFDFKTSPVQAAYVNGSSMHVLDFEPMWSPANHQLSTNLPAILALAEYKGMGGREAATALIKGIEMVGWLREASGQFDPKIIRFHPPGLVGPLGAAVAAGHMLGLSVKQLRWALGIAASRCGSVLANTGTMTKSTHCGLACSLGLDAAMLAARGFTGNADILETFRGYVQMFMGDDFNYEKLMQYGPPYRIVTPGYAIKMFPSQFATHFVITAGLELHAQIVDPARIKAVRLTTPVMEYINRQKPLTGLAGKFSWQYTTACALLDGKVTMDTFEDEKRFSPAVEAMLDKVELEMRDDIPGRFEELYVLLEVELDDGTVLKTRCDGPRGKWGTPPITVEEHLVKVRDCLSTRLSERDRERVIELGSHFDQLTASDIAEAMAIVRCPQA